MAKRKTKTDWPILKTYDRHHLNRVAMPLGGIGTGTVSLGGRGNLRDWELANRPAKGFTPMAEGVAPCFLLWARAKDAEPVTRLLEGPLPFEDYEGASGSPAPNHGFPRFRRAAFHTAYPLGQVELDDADVPLTVTLQAFNPLVPADAEASGLPVAVLRFLLRNRSEASVEASLCGVLPNFIGEDGSGRGGAPARNRIRFRERGGLRGLFYDSLGVDPAADACGTLALVTADQGELTARTTWASGSWTSGKLDFWDDFSADGRLEPRRSDANRPVGAMALRTRVPAGRARTLTFVLAWHFPNRPTWTPEACEHHGCADRKTVGNYYATLYRDAWEAASRIVPKLPELERRTVTFVRAFCESDLPDVVKEAALFNLSTLRSQTCFRTPDGRLFGWEGCSDHAGCCLGSCTHVWNYEHATGFLFGDLARGMREVEFGVATNEDGHMAFRVSLPLEITRAHRSGEAMAAADGQMGSILRVYREWQLSGDDGWLRALWPSIRRALEFCWRPGGWDADADGVMEGCQHNTMDVEYYGPNPQMEGWYLGALRAAEEMARRVRDNPFAETCRRLFESGRKWTDEHLFNGEYYEHEIRPIRNATDIAPGLRSHMGAADPARPAFQLGAGCLVDQLVGEGTANLLGLGPLLAPRHVRRTLRSILKYNRRRTFHGHFCHHRSYVLGDESALLMASYPRGDRPEQPFPYFTEVMTGFEYTVATHLLLEGRDREGLAVMRDIRRRYDGQRRNPFDEAECGHHYARAMASWGAVPAWTGFRWSGVTDTFSVAARPGTFFWSNGTAWGTYAVKGAGKNRWRLQVRVLGGRLDVKEAEVGGKPAAACNVKHG